MLVHELALHWKATQTFFSAQWLSVDKITYGWIADMVSGGQWSWCPFSTLCFIERNNFSWRKDIKQDWCTYFLIIEHSLIIMIEAINSSFFRFESELFNRVISDSRLIHSISLPVAGMLRTIAGRLQGRKCIKIWSSFLSFNIFALWIIFDSFKSLDMST